MSDNWVVQNLENALETWNEKLSEIWTLITTTPQNFKGGGISLHTGNFLQMGYIGATCQSVCGTGTHPRCRAVRAFMGNP